jgi:hypothetical protein
MATTTNYGWTTPDNTALVKDGASAIRTLGSSVDTTVKALSPGTTAGDIDYYTSSTAKSRLAIGSTGQVLTVAAGVPSWATSSSGGMTLISTTTLTGASVTLSSIPQTYNHLEIVIQNFRPATDGAYVLMRFNADATASRHGNRQTVSGTNATFADNYGQVTQGTDSGAATQGLFYGMIPNYTNTATWKTMQTIVDFQNNETTTTNFNWFNANGVFYNQTTAVSSLYFAPSSGNFTSGTLLLYGVK